MDLNIGQNLGILVLALGCFALYGITERRRSWAARVINYTALALFAALVVLDAVLAAVFDGRYLSALVAIVIAVSACFAEAWGKKKATKAAYKREKLLQEVQRRAEQELAEERAMEQQEGAEQ